jgi:hypothetical protein
MSWEYFVTASFGHSHDVGGATILALIIHGHYTRVIVDRKLILPGLSELISLLHERPSTYVTV